MHSLALTLSAAVVGVIGLLILFQSAKVGLSEATGGLAAAGLFVMSGLLSVAAAIVDHGARRS